ncbi:TolC family protein [Polaromonas sp. P1(28)-8]|nr:TolC family protein [Polaromonas sp. P1(28)-8]
MSALMLYTVNLGVAAQDMDFDGALRAALERAPLLQARGASVQGAQALQTSAAQLPDPKLTLGIDSLPVNGPNRGSLSRDDFTQRQIGWTQDVPNRAKRAARADAAQARTERERALLQMEQLTVRHETGLAWLASHFSGKRLALFDELIVQQELMKRPPRPNWQQEKSTRPTSAPLSLKHWPWQTGAMSCSAKQRNPAPCCAAGLAMQPAREDRHRNSR